MTEKQVQASINQHLRKIRALELEMEVISRFAANPQAHLAYLETRTERLLRSLESERDFLYLLESGDIESYQDCMQ